MDRGQDSGLSKAPGHQTLSHANPTAISHTHSSCRIIGLMLGELLLSVTIGGRWEPWGRLCCMVLPVGTAAGATPASPRSPSQEVAGCLQRNPFNSQVTTSSGPC